MTLRRGGLGRGYDVRNTHRGGTVVRSDLLRDPRNALDPNGSRVEGWELMFGVAPNPDPEGGNWTVLIASPEADDDEDDPALTVVALTEDVDDLPKVTEKELRFDLYEDSVGEPHAVYSGVSLHRHGNGPGECEVFLAEEDRTTVEDVPDDLRRAVEDVMEFEIHGPGDLPLDVDPVHVSDLTDDDEIPEGFN